MLLVGVVDEDGVTEVDGAGVDVAVEVEVEGFTGDGVTEILQPERLTTAATAAMATRTRVRVICLPQSVWGRSRELLPPIAFGGFWIDPAQVLQLRLA